jgi:hypothetical protein
MSEVKKTMMIKNSKVQGQRERRGKNWTEKER